MSGNIISDHQMNFMNAIAGNAPPHAVEYLLTVASRGRIQINMTHQHHGVTPLMALISRPDDDDTIRVAEILLRNGARVDERDTSGPGVTALLMAAQEGKPRFLQFLIDRGGSIDMCGLRSCTLPIYLAAQNNHTSCVVTLVKAAREQNKQSSMIDARCKRGCTPCNEAVSRAHPVIVGVLAKAGADLRLACPMEYCLPDRGDINVDPSPDFPVHFALGMSVRSFVTLACAHCGETSKQVSGCSRCHMACYCNASHQKANWKSHKLVCKQLRCGQDMVFPDEVMPVPQKEQIDFQDGDFGELDNETQTCKDYNREQHPVWEYDAGERGTSNWIRYPPRIEEGMESLIESGSPRYMYRPNNIDATGTYEQVMSASPPPNCATRYVYYCDMTERAIYTGAARAVRRNGKREFREAEARE